MTVKALMPERVNLVEPLPHQGTAMRTTDTTQPQLDLWSDAVTEPIGASPRSGDVDSSTKRRTPRTTPSSRTSPTATRTGTTRTTSSGLAPSADSHLTEGLVRAWLDCRRSKGNSRSAQAFHSFIERNICSLRDRLRDRTYTPGRSYCFVVTHPRAREVWAAPFEDRVVHHLWYGLAGPILEKSFDVASAACIKGRGTSYAALRLEHDVRSITQNWSRPAYYLKCDLANFFVSIDKLRLQQLLHRRIQDPFLQWLTDAIFMHDPRLDFELRGDIRRMELVPPHKRLLNAPAHHGLPIGNLSSQVGANVYLDVLDKFVRHQLHARYYGRYVDDFYILHESAQWLNEALTRINEFLPASLGAQLNPRKTILQPVDRGIDFVGQVVKPWHRVMRPRTVETALHRLEVMPADKLFMDGNSYLGLLSQPDAGHTDRARIARALLRRGHVVNGDLKKIFRRSTNDA